MEMKTTGATEFLELFGSFTVADIFKFILAAIFLYFIYKKVSEYLLKKHDEEVAKNEKFKEVMESVSKYPEYRQQSLNIQTKLNKDIAELKKTVEKQGERLEEIEKTNKRRERNKLRDRIIQNYRYYTNKDTNPDQTWTELESEAFWALIDDYELSDGNGYVHTEVIPAMRLLTVITPGEN